MSKSETKTKSTRGVKKVAGGREAAGAQKQAAVPAQGFYVYCVGGRDALAPLFDEELPGAIEGESDLELVGGELAAVVSRVPLEDYGEGALASRLADATWTATRALRHERVVEHFARRASVAPLRFGTIYLRRESVERMLEERGAQLRSVLGRLGGREEWGVNVFVERARLREEVVNVSGRLREMCERATRSSPGQGYLLRKKIESLRDEEARSETRRVASEVEERLAEVCDGAARLRVLKDEATEQGELAARFAFLVARTRFKEFRAAAERLAEEYTPLGFRFELTGPWPAYNFVVFDEEREKRG
ncbi:MAG: GvpL/GvpF family gas vesicle protein [Acidobacteriota bacterium]|nr:GvpL/GvpF family gas vesicle protein [Acidobacteriota bacterium]MDQ5836312.1 GvpL/GvpF family gas vesicle protein [Acidobacteriota bacterium]